MVQWDKWDTSYRDKKNTPTETECGKMTEKPRPYVDVIEIFDKYIVVTVKLDDETNSGFNIATMKRIATDTNGFAIGRAHNNPLLYNREYYIELEDGTLDSYFANVIAENFYSTLYSKGHQNLVVSKIVNHQRDGSAVTKENDFTGKHYNITKNTTKGL